jgi:hypothetical protein
MAFGYFKTSAPINWAITMINIRPIVVLCCFLASACASDRSQIAPIVRTGEAAKAYADAKRAYADSLSRSIGIPRSSKYRLVAIVGPEWQIGDSIDVDNPANLLTTKCRFSSAKLPSATTFTQDPTVDNQAPIEFSLGLPAGVIKAFSKMAVTAKIDIKRQSIGNYSLSALAGPIVAEDDFESALQEKDCYASRKGPSLIVRGVISGIESFSSTKSYNFDATAKVETMDAFVFKYDPSKHFELTDKTSAPKFYILTLDTPTTLGPGGDGTLTAPPPEVLTKLESANVEKY